MLKGERESLIWLANILFRIKDQILDFVTTRYKALSPLIDYRYVSKRHAGRPVSPPPIPGIEPGLDTYHSALLVTF